MREERRGLASWLRLGFMIAALALGARAYHDHISAHLPWWQWFAELVAGVALLGLALHDGQGAPESRWRRGIRWTAGGVAVVAGCAGALLIPQPGQELPAGMAVVTGMVAFLLYRWVPFAGEDVRNLTGGMLDEARSSDPMENGRGSDDEGPADRSRRPTGGSPRLVLRWAARRRWLLASIIAATGLAAGVGAASLNEQGRYLDAFVLWLASLGLFALGMWRADRPPVRFAATWREEGGPELSPRGQALALLLVLVLAAALRVTLLDDLPPTVNPDEGRLGRYAERLWSQGFPNVFGLGWNFFPHLSFIVQSAWLELLGTSKANLRLSSATIGVLSLVPLFFWVRRWWGSAIALLAVMILAINQTSVAWSRIGLNNIHALLVAGLMLAAFARVLQTRRLLDWVWFGYATGLAFHTYHATKVFPALLAGAVLFFAFGIRGFLRHYLGGAVVGALAFMLCLGPVSVGMVKRWDGLVATTSHAFDSGKLVDAYSRGDNYRVRHFIRTHVGHSFLVLFSQLSPRGPFLNPLLAVPFLLGAGWMLWRWRDPRHLLVVVWTVGIVVNGSVMTNYPPAVARILGVLPLMCVVAAVVAGRVRALVHRCSPRLGDLVAVPLLAVWLGTSLQQDWYGYFVAQPRVRVGDVMTAICRVIDNTPLPATIYMAGGEIMAEPKVAANDCMIAPHPDRLLVNLSNDPAVAPVPPTNRGSAALIISHRQRALLPLVRHYYPGAPVEEVHDRHRAVLYIVRLSERLLAHTRGLQATYRAGDRMWPAPRPVGEFTAPQGADRPVEATWRGQLWIPEPGRYRFRARGAELRVDGEPAEQEAPRDMAAGWHAIALQATFDGRTQPVILQWRKPPDGKWEQVPQAFLNPHPGAHGLLGRYFDHAVEAGTEAPIAAGASYERIDSAISFDLYRQFDEPPPQPFAARPSTMEWTGTVEFPEGAVQLVRLETTGPAEVYLDGRLILSASGQPQGESVQASVEVGEGALPILVRAVRPKNSPASFWKLRLLWMQPGGDWSAFARYQPPGALAVR